MFMICASRPHQNNRFPAMRIASAQTLDNLLADRFFSALNARNSFGRPSKEVGDPKKQAI
jgi:hypothetical protein